LKLLQQKNQNMFLALANRRLSHKNVFAIAMAVSPHLPLEKILLPRQGRHHRFSSEIIATTTIIIPHIHFFTAKLLSFFVSPNRCTRKTRHEKPIHHPGTVMYTTART